MRICSDLYGTEAKKVIELIWKTENADDFFVDYAMDCEGVEICFTLAPESARSANENNPVRGKELMLATQGLARADGLTTGGRKR